MNPDAKDAKLESSLFSLLPENVVEEILLWLPAESLVRFKRVQKSWRALISDQSFAKKHLRASIDSGKTSSSATLLFEFSYQGGARRMLANEQAILLASISSEDEDNNGDIRCVVDEPGFPQIVKEKMALAVFNSDISVSHCNGIFCCSRGVGKIVLCNPTLKELKCITSPTLEFKCAYTGEGFGYDSRGDDYKFVRIVYSLLNFSLAHAPAPAPLADMTRTAHLYTLGTDSWREIKIDVKVGSLFLYERGVYCKDVYYWRSLPYQGDKATVLAFDMSKEEFRSIPLPDGVEQDVVKNNIRKSLALWKESVVLFNLIGDPPHSMLLEMWVMVDKFGGVEGDASWTKHLTIGPLANVRSPLDFWKDDELLLESSEGGIVSYNIFTKTVRRIIPTGPMVSSYRYHVESYVNSLVSIKTNIENR